MRIGKLCVCIVLVLIPVFCASCETIKTDAARNAYVSPGF